jgi:hypothetical protein
MLNELKNLYYDLKFFCGYGINCTVIFGDILEYNNHHASIIEWTDKNIKGKASFKQTCFWWWENDKIYHWSRLEIVNNVLIARFSRPNDAMLFKLRWGNI